MGDLQTKKKSSLRGGTTKFLDLFFIGAFATKVWISQEVWLLDFLSKGQNHSCGGWVGVKRPPPMKNRIMFLLCRAV